VKSETVNVLSGIRWYAATWGHRPSDQEQMRN